MNKKFVEVIETEATPKKGIDIGYNSYLGREKRNEDLIEAESYVLDFIELDSQVEAEVLKEASDWVVEEYLVWSSYNELYESHSQGEALKNYPADSFGEYIIVKDGHFDGIVLWAEQKGGNGWSGSHYGNYCLLFADGTVCGKNEKYESISTDEHSDKDSYIYNLKLKSEAREPFSIRR